MPYNYSSWYRSLRPACMLFQTRCPRFVYGNIFDRHKKIHVRAQGNLSYLYSKNCASTETWSSTWRKKRFSCLHPGPRVEYSTISELIKCVKVDKIWQSNAEKNYTNLSYQFLPSFDPPLMSALTVQ